MKHFNRFLSLFVVVCLLLNLSEFYQKPILLMNVASAAELSQDTVLSDEIIDLIGIESSTKDVKLKVEETAKVTISGVYSNDSKKDVTKFVEWNVDNSQIVEISQGLFRGKNAGKATVTATYEDQVFQLNIEVLSAEVNDTQAETDLILQQLEAITTELVITEDGETNIPSVMAIFKDEGKLDVTNEIQWDVENPEIATVYQQQIKAAKAGTTKLIGKYKEHQIEIKVTVKSADLNEENLEQDKQEQTEQNVPSNNLNVTLANYGTITLTKGQSYKFTGIHTTTAYVKSNASSNNTYDYAKYRPDGTGSDYALDSKSTSRGVIPGESIIVTVTSNNPVTFTFNEAQINPEKSSTPALLRKQVAKGDSITLTDLGGKLNEITVEGSSREYSYQSYKSDGTLAYENYDYTSGTVNIPASGKLIATVTSNDPILFAGYYDLIGEEPTSKALVFDTLEKGQSFVFTNHSAKAQTIKTNGSSSTNSKRVYDSAIYKEDGTVHLQDADAVATTKSIPAGGRVIVTASSDLPVTFKAFTTYFTGDRSENPALFVKVLEKDETLKVLNTSAESVSILVNGSTTKRFSYQLLKSDGSLYQKSYDSYLTSLSVPAGGKLIATTISDTPVTIRGYFNIFKEEGSSEALITKILEKGKSYEFINQTTSSQTIDTDGTSASTGKKTFDYAIYDGLGNAHSQGIDSGNSSRSVPAGGKIVVTVTSDLPVTFRAFISFFTGQDRVSPALLKQSVSKGQAISIMNQNSGSSELIASSSNGKFSYQVIAEGKVTTSSHNGFTTRSIPGGANVLATVTSDESVQFIGFYDNFKSVVDSSPSIIEKTLVNGASYELNNKTNETQSVDIRTDETKSFDLAMYNQDGTGSSLEIKALGTSRSVPPGGKIIFTSNSDTPVTIKGFLTDFEGKDSSNPALLTQTVQLGQTFTFKNHSSVETELHRIDVFSVVERFDYEISDRNGTLVSQESNTSKTSLKIPAGGQIKVTVTTEQPITFFGYYNHFTNINGGGNGIQFTAVDVNSFTDVLKSNNEIAYFKMTSENTGVHRIFTSPYLGNGPEVDTKLTIYADPNLQNEIAMNDNHNGPYGSLFSKIEWDAVANTTYYMKLESTTGLQTRLSLEEDLDNSRESAVPAEWDEIYTDRLSSPYDTDYFKLTVDELAYLNLHVTDNILILEDDNGNQLKTFYPNPEDTLFIPEKTGTYYAKVIWNKEALKKSSRFFSVPEPWGQSYNAGFHRVKIVSENKILDTTPGAQKNVTLQWGFHESHPNVVIQVRHKGQVVYEEIRTNQPGKTNLNFTWDGRYTKIVPGKYAENGLYSVRILATDAPQYPINGHISVLNTIELDEYDSQQLVSFYNATISSDKIRIMQEDLQKMEFYLGPVTGAYDEEFLMSVIAFEMVLNRSTHVSINLTFGGEPLEEKGEITNRLLNYSHAGASVGRDKYGNYASYLFNGDIIIYVTAAELIPAFRVYKGSGKVVKKKVKNQDELCDCFIAGTKVLTDTGEKSIESIMVGDKVLSKNDESGEVAYKEVEWLYQREVEQTYNITVDGEQISTTAEHPFWVDGKGWVKTENLEAGDILSTVQGKQLAVVRVDKNQEKQIVYNFKVKDFHTYFVSNLFIWTHNSCDISPETLAQYARNSRPNDGLQDATVSTFVVHQAALIFVGKNSTIKKAGDGIWYVSENNLLRVRTGKKFGKNNYEANFETLDKNGVVIKNYHVVVK